jgi:hypothetical protein
MRPLLSLVQAFIAAAAVFAATAAASQQVDIELVLAVDVSASMDPREQVLQRRGYVGAFRHPEVVEAITSGSRGRIAVTYVEWAGTYQRVVVPWRIVGDLEDALAFAAELESQPMSQHDRTSISDGLLFAANQFDRSPAVGERRAIDISGDGANNLGPPIAPTRDAVIARGITINGLPIVIRPSPSGFPFGSFDLRLYYEDCVIGGPGAFLVTVEDAEGFEFAIRHKMLLEIAGLPPAVILATEAVHLGPETDCLAGEHWFSGSPR